MYNLHQWIEPRGFTAAATRLPFFWQSSLALFWSMRQCANNQDRTHAAAAFWAHAYRPLLAPVAHLRHDPSQAGPFLFRPHVDPAKSVALCFSVRGFIVTRDSQSQSFFGPLDFALAMVDAS